MKKGFFLLVLFLLYPFSSFGEEFLIRRHSAQMPKNMAVDEESGGKEGARRIGTIREIVRKIEAQKGSAGIPLRKMPLDWPVSGYITSSFGPRKSPFTGKMRMHTGMDIGAPKGTKILAPADGIVIYSGWGNGYGQMVEIYHTRGMITRYAHMSERNVGIGEKIRKGTQIGKIGSTGRSTGPHLHYEILLSGVPTNPVRHITARN